MPSRILTVMSKRQNRALTRSDDGKWLPGTSPNPGGRPRGLASKVREVTRDGADPIQILVNVLEGNVAGTRVKDQIEASKILLDKGFGKATTVIDADVHYGRQDPNDDELNKLSVEQLTGLLELMDKLGTEGVVKFARALEQDGAIEGKYRDARDEA